MDELLKKLQYKNQTSCLILDLPKNMHAIKDLFPVKITESEKDTHDFIMIFAFSIRDATEKISRVISKLEDDQLLWFCYPKKSATHYKSNLNREVSWELFEEYGFRPVRQIAIDNDWSALRFRDKKYVE